MFSEGSIGVRSDGTHPEAFCVSSGMGSGVYPLCRVHHFFSFLMQTTDDIYYFDTEGVTMQLLETEPNSVDPTNVHGEKESASLLRRGWKSLKRGVKTTGDKIKESEVGVAASVHRRWLRERPRRFRRSVTATSASASPPPRVSPSWL